MFKVQNVFILEHLYDSLLFKGLLVQIPSAPWLPLFFHSSKVLSCGLFQWALISAIQSFTSCWWLYICGLTFPSISVLYFQLPEGHLLLWRTVISGSAGHILDWFFILHLPPFSLHIPPNPCSSPFKGNPLADCEDEPLLENWNFLWGNSSHVTFCNSKKYEWRTFKNM